MGRHLPGLPSTTVAVYAGPSFRRGVRSNATLSDHRALLGVLLGLPTPPSYLGPDLRAIFAPEALSRDQERQLPALRAQPVPEGTPHWRLTSRRARARSSVCQEAVRVLPMQALLLCVLLTLEFWRRCLAEDDRARSLSAQERRARNPGRARAARLGQRPGLPLAATRTPPLTPSGWPRGVRSATRATLEPRPCKTLIDSQRVAEIAESSERTINAAPHRRTRGILGLALRGVARAFNAEGLTGILGSAVFGIVRAFNAEAAEFSRPSLQESAAEFAGRICGRARVCGPSLRPRETENDALDATREPKKL